MTEPPAARPAVPGTAHGAVAAPAAGGPLFRRYQRLMEPVYRRLDPASADWARAADVWFYTTPAGRIFNVLMIALIALTAWGLARLSIPVSLAVGLAIALWLSLMATALAPWLQPDRYRGRRLWRSVAVGALSTILGLAVGAAVGGAHRAYAGGADLLTAAWDGLARVWQLASGEPLLPSVLVFVAVVAFLQWGVSQWRLHIGQLELERLRLARQRDAASMRGREAQMRVLQTQIRPHFVFNTLAALQHWVDTADARAGPLLAALTRFLRLSTDMLGQDAVTLAQELDLTRQYLAVMQDRIGVRLRYAVEADEACTAQRLPPALVLTLVENAIEHGVSFAPEGGVVTVSARVAVAPDGSTRVRVEVRNTGVPLAEPVQEGVGLANTRERLRHHFGPWARLWLGSRDGQTLAVLSWPLLAKPGGSGLQAPDPAAHGEPPSRQPPGRPQATPDPNASPAGCAATPAASPQAPRTGTPPP